METPKVTNIRSKQGDYRSIKLDILALEELKHIREYWLRAANHNPSQTCMVRRAVDIYTQYIDNLADPSDELYYLKDRALGNDKVEMEPIKPLEGWKTFNDRLISALEQLKDTFKKETGLND